MKYADKIQLCWYFVYYNASGYFSIQIWLLCSIAQNILNTHFKTSKLWHKLDNMCLGYPVPLNSHDTRLIIILQTHKWKCKGISAIIKFVISQITEVNSLICTIEDTIIPLISVIEYANIKDKILRSTQFAT